MATTTTTRHRGIGLLFATAAVPSEILDGLRQQQEGATLEFHTQQGSGSGSGGRGGPTAPTAGDTVTIWCQGVQWKADVVSLPSPTAVGQGSTELTLDNFTAVRRPPKRKAAAAVTTTTADSSRPPTSGDRKRSRSPSQTSSSSEEVDPAAAREENLKPKVVPTTLASLDFGMDWTTSAFSDATMKRFEGISIPKSMRECSSLQSGQQQQDEGEVAPAAHLGLATVSSYRELSLTYNRIRTEFDQLSALLTSHEELSDRSVAWLRSPECSLPECASCREELKVWFAENTPKAQRLLGVHGRMKSFLTLSIRYLEDFVNLRSLGVAL